ncbi:hypothetical protein SPRG_13370 [Saprolegnia parasitica CBS 223.65]|uniref:Uncharacterized protein n=1 Tax=Saprolegnia parasitica (strain CBS 223.65) TaxID=695850 RepID=A0A067BSQ7_SAPPC|nr:hypothetical protein SPRG_13370 [Saprolegnia parasitica CBS 223.65]KDO21559.1 hypothetical protein SPRG_13370 [Saprolegnia parasitica CBS 223.65]|eukprot:XP_012207736.1 hypothetical protein SPRG_13370 [Saprolegnia parasitica CBS 223.65]
MYAAPPMPMKDEAYLNPMLLHRRPHHPPAYVEPRYMPESWKPALELPPSYGFRPAPFQMLATDSLFSDRDFLDTIISDMQQDDMTPRGSSTAVPLARRY